MFHLTTDASHHLFFHRLEDFQLAGNGGQLVLHLDSVGTDDLLEGSTFDLVTLQFCHIGVAIDILYPT